MPKQKSPPTPPSDEQRDRAAKAYSYTHDGTVLSMTSAVFKDYTRHLRDTVSANRRERRVALALARSDRVQAAVNKAIQRQLDKVAKHFPLRKIRVTVEAEQRRKAPNWSKRIKPPARVQLPKNNGPLIDKQGRRGIFMMIDYDGAKGHQMGITGRRIVYMTNPEHCELDPTGNSIFMSSLGDDLAEIVMGADLLELAQRESRTDAKLDVNIIIRLPHDVSQEVRVEIMRAVTHELFGRHDLPFTAALHKPDENSNQRNYHMHICASWRPMKRTGPYEWEISQDWRGDLDGREYWRHARRRVAEIKTAVLARAGIDRQFTHLSNAERGMVEKPQKKLDKQQVRRARAGEFVADNEANRRLIARNETLAAKLKAKKAAVKRSATRRRIAALKIAASVTALAMPRLRAAPVTNGVSAPPALSANRQDRATERSAFIGRTAALPDRLFTPSISIVRLDNAAPPALRMAGLQQQEAPNLVPAQFQGRTTTSGLRVTAQPFANTGSANQNVTLSYTKFSPPPNTARLSKTATRTARNLFTGRPAMPTQTPSRSVSLQAAKTVADTNNSAALHQAKRTTGPSLEAVKPAYLVFHKSPAALANVADRKTTAPLMRAAKFFASKLPNARTIRKTAEVSNVEPSTINIADHPSYKTTVPSFDKAIIWLSQRSVPGCLRPAILPVADVSALPSTLARASMTSAAERDILTAMALTNKAMDRVEDDANRRRQDQIRHSRTAEPQAVTVAAERKPSGYSAPKAFAQHGLGEALAFAKEIQDQAVRFFPDGKGGLTVDDVIIAKRGLNETALQHERVQKLFRAEMRAQNEEFAQIRMQLAKHGTAEKLDEEDKAIAALPVHIQQRVVRWRGKGILPWLCSQVVDEQIKKSQSAYDNWVEANAARDSSRYPLAQAALLQTKKWPCSMPQGSFNQIEDQARHHRKRNLRSHGTVIDGWGIE